MFLQGGRYLVPIALGILGGQHHKCFDQRAALRVGLGDDRYIGDRGMVEQAVFNFARANAVARGLEHIICAASVPVVPVFIDAGQITRAAPVAREFVRRT